MKGTLFAVALLTVSAATAQDRDPAPANLETLSAAVETGIPADGDWVARTADGVARVGDILGLNVETRSCGGRVCLFEVRLPADSDSQSTTYRVVRELRRQQILANVTVLRSPNNDFINLYLEKR